MLLSDDELLRNFTCRLESSKRIDLATAWATEGPALDALEAEAKRPDVSPESDLYRPGTPIRFHMVAKGKGLYRLH